MKCLSIRQPWAWLIMHGGKDIENRTWETLYRGPVAIHAGKAWHDHYDPDDPDDFSDMIYNMIADTQPMPSIPCHRNLERGGIVGVAEIADVVSLHNACRIESPWFEGPFGFVIKNPRPIEFVPYRGQLGLFDIPDHVVLDRLD